MIPNHCETTMLLFAGRQIFDLKPCDGLQVVKTFICHLVVEYHCRQRDDSAEKEKNGHDPDDPEVQVHADAHGSEIFEGNAQITPHTLVPD